MPRNRRANPFLDIEADVDNESEVDPESEEEDQESRLDYFIQDEVEDDTNSVAFKTWAELLQEDQLEQEEETVSFIRHLQDRLNERSSPNLTTVAARSSDGTILMPAYPLYRVACMPGQEEAVMFYLYQKIRDEKIASIIVRPTIVGYVYVEGMLDGDVRALLMKTPGIRKTKSGPVTEGIAQGDWSKVLSMTGRAEKAVEGEWVTIRDGSIYDGDVGLVVRVESWGVEILVVPRIPRVVTEQEVLDGASVLKKRKRLQGIPEARLWLEPKEAKARGWDIEETSPNCYKVGTSNFEYGLLRGFCSFYGIRPSPPFISSSTFFYFTSSNHPSAVTAQYRSPRPQEWVIRHDDLIKDTESDRRGRVRKIETTYAEIEAEDGSGLFSVPWKSLRKVVRIGDYIDIVAGPFKERSGWVVSFQGDVTTIVTTQNHNVLHVEAHVNWIALSSTPFVGSAKLPSHPSAIPRDHLPWVGLRVLIVKTAHKGRHGIIQNWFRREDDYGLIVRLEEYNPNAPFHDLTLGYSDVVEANSKDQLRDYFKKRHKYIPPPTTITQTQTSTSDDPDEKLAGPSWNQTPMHTPMHSSTASSSTPAWDPNSLTPLSGEASPTQAPPPSAHELLDQRLAGLSFKVNIHGGGIPGTATTVTVMEKENGNLGFRGSRQGKECWFDSGWVHPRRPVPNRGDNGPIVVTRGMRCGTHVRRISSYYEGSRCLMRCLVVAYSHEHGDAETEEEIPLEPEDAVLRWESQEEKTRNKPLTAKLRLRAKKSS